MSTQPAPPESQRRHWYEYDSGWTPVQLPGDAVSVCPSCALPVIVGGDTFTGAAAVTTAVAAELAVLAPALLLAVTATRTVDPRSADTSA
jgi:hypothetical protein